jgi:hypothetical protein
MDGKPSWQSVVIAVAVIALVGVFFVVGLTQTNSNDDFLKVWGAVGTISGVVAGAIPSFFFKAQADKATGHAARATAAATQQAERVQALAGAADREVIDKAVEMAPRAFEGWTPPGR